MKQFGVTRKRRLPSGGPGQQRRQQQFSPGPLCKSTLAGRRPNIADVAPASSANTCGWWVADRGPFLRNRNWNSISVARGARYKISRPFYGEYARRYVNPSGYCDPRSVCAVVDGVTVESVRPCANNSQRRVSSKNCFCTFGSFCASACCTQCVACS